MICETKRNIGDLVCVNIVNRKTDGITTVEQIFTKIVQIIFFKGGFIYRTDVGCYAEKDVFDNKEQASKSASDYLKRNIVFHS